MADETVQQSDVLAFLGLLGIDPANTYSATLEVTPAAVGVAVKLLPLDASGVPVTLGGDPDAVQPPTTGLAWEVPITSTKLQVAAPKKTGRKK